MLFYRIGIQVFALAMRIAALWNTKARLWINGRKQWEKALQEKIKAPSNSPKGEDKKSL